MAYVPPLTDLTSLQYFAARLADLLPCGEVPPRMVVGEALARAGGYPDAQALHAAAKALPLSWRAAAEVPTLPGVSARRLRDWTGPLHKALAQAPHASRLDALARSWGHLSAFALYWKVAHQHPGQMFADVLYRSQPEAAWETPPDPWGPLCSTAYLILGQDGQGGDWGLTEAGACRHVAVLGPTDRQADRTADWVWQCHRAGKGWGWMGTDRAWAHHRRQPLPDAPIWDWSGEGGADLDLQGSSLTALMAIQRALVSSVLCVDLQPGTLSTLLRQSPHPQAQALEGEDVLYRISQQIQDHLRSPLTLRALIGVWQAALGSPEATSLPTDQQELGRRIAPSLSSLAPVADALQTHLAALLRRFSGTQTALSSDALRDKHNRWILIVPEAKGAINTLVQHILMHHLHQTWIEQLGVSLTAPAEMATSPRHVQLWIMALDESTWEGHEILMAQARAIDLAMVVCNERFPDLPALMANLGTQIWLGPFQPSPRALPRASCLGAEEGVLWVSKVPVAQGLKDPG